MSSNSATSGIRRRNTRRLGSGIHVFLCVFGASVFSLLPSCSGLASPSRAKGSGTGFGAPKSIQQHTVDVSPEAQKLVQVLQEQGADIAGTEIGVDVTGMRGIYATKNWSKDKIICKIPSDLALALSDPSKNGDDAPTIAHGGANFLKFYKTNEQAAQQWSFYLNCLPGPNEIPKTPDFFGDEELALLEFPRIIAAAQRRKQEIKQVAAETGIDEAELQRATALVSSRAFPLAVAEADEDLQTDVGDIALDERGQVMTKAGERKFIRVLCPYIDLANHKSSQCNAKWTVLDPEKDEAFFALVATRNIKAGKEITISYGSQVDSSVELLMNYGFVPLENPFDEFMLKKGGDDCIVSADQWTTTLEEDKRMLSMTEGDAEAENLRKILQFRVRLKESYQSEYK